MKTALTLITVLAIVQAASAGFYASTDRCSYTGSVTKYASLADAQAASNAIGTYAIPARSTTAPYNTAYRDAAFFIVNDAPAYYSNFNTFMTAWYYSTAQDKAEYSGWGNPNNTNTGFVQLYDSDNSTASSMSGSFNSSLNAFTLSVSGTNADAADTARLWPAPLVGGAAKLSAGTFLSYDLDVVFSGLSAGWDAAKGMYTSSSHPTAVDGTFSAIFQNTNTQDTNYNGFYVVSFTFGLDNWAYAQGSALNGELAVSEFGSTVPEPLTMSLLGLGGLLIARKRK